MRIAGKIFRIVLNLVYSFVLFCFVILSPYDYSEGYKYKRIDDDIMFFFLALWSLAVLCLGVSLPVFRKRPRVVFVWSIVLIVLSVARLVSLWIALFSA